jgi:hypothetical protein
MSPRRVFDFGSAGACRGGGPAGRSFGEGNALGFEGVFVGFFGSRIVRLCDRPKTVVALQLSRQRGLCHQRDIDLGSRRAPKRSIPTRAEGRYQTDLRLRRWLGCLRATTQNAARIQIRPWLLAALEPAESWRSGGGATICDSLAAELFAPSFLARRAVVLEQRCIETQK